MHDFLSHTGNLILFPRAALRNLLADPRRLAFGFCGILTLSVLYIIAISIALARNPTTLPLVFPVLNIPTEKYYAYERLFLLPVAVASVILHSGVVRLIAKPLGGKGKFEDLIALLGFAYVLIALTMGLPDLVIAVSGWQVTAVGPHVVIGTVWFFILSLLAVKETEDLSWGLTALAALAGFLANASVQFVFMR